MAQTASSLRLRRPPSLRRFAVQKALPGRKPSEVGLMPLAHLQRLDPEHLGVRPASGTRVHGSSCRTLCRRSRSTSITFPGEPRAITRAAGRVQGPRYRAARSRSRRCVSGISDKSTRNSAKARAFSARNASSLNQLLDRGPSNTTFLGHTFRGLACNLKPCAQMGALDVSVGDGHRSLSRCIQVKAPNRCQNIGPLPVVDLGSSVLESTWINLLGVEINC